MPEANTTPPKAFISYSWTTPEHKDWVMKLSEDLVEAGIDVILDEWHLREGADKFVFMEQMVTDPEFKKVICICDRAYAQKADKRKGGVGTESQIISTEIYEQVAKAGQEQKFVALIAEKDESGQACLPVFLRSRLYIDMSTTDLRIDNLERLVRWVYDKPMYKRPELGSMPVYLNGDENIKLGTNSRFRQAIDAVKNHKPAALSLLKDYFSTFTQNLEKFRIVKEPNKEFDDLVVENVAAFLPYRDEAVDLIHAAVKSQPNSQTFSAIHEFFELLLPYTYIPQRIMGQSEGWEADNFKIFAYELFLYANAALIKNKSFDGVNDLLEQGYFCPTGYHNAPDGKLTYFTRFNDCPESLIQRNRRLNIIHINPLAEMTKNRAKRTDLTFDDVMQADLFLYLRSQLYPEIEGLVKWEWSPYTLGYARHRYNTFEVFARAKSKRYFDQMKTGLGIAGKDNLVKLVEDFNDEKKRRLNWKGAPINFVSLLNIEEIATIP